MCQMFYRSQKNTFVPTFRGASKHTLIHDVHITVTSLHYVRHLIEPTCIVEAVNRRLFFQPALSNE